MTTNPSPVRVRFAPSPTGHLHVGGARTAIFNWLFARHHGGTFIVRVEDTDQARSTVESEAMVLDDLRWLGLQWDEGPDVGGPHAPYRQSERLSMYGATGQRLLELRHAYRCFCSEEMLEAKRKKAEVEKRPPHYDLTCWRLSPSEIEERVAAHAPFALRFHVPKNDDAPFSADVTIHDLIRGEVTWKRESLGDFILVRSDGLPTYNFSVVVDDHDMQITHVIRAEEHLTNTHRQVLIYRALGWEVPELAHVSLILGTDRAKLSKRHGATSVAAYADDGILSEAMVNYLTLLGWSSPDGAEVFSIEHAVAVFALDRVNAAPAVFDPHKLEWLNGQYIHVADPASLRKYVVPYLYNAGWLREETPDVDAWLDEAIDAVKKGIGKLSQFVAAMRLLFEFEPRHVLENETLATVVPEPSAKALMQILAKDLTEHGAPVDAAGYHALADRLKQASGLKGKALFMPLRVAVTGSDHGPELVRVIPLLEKASYVRGLAAVLPPLARVESLLAAIGV
ncbi:MAG TPA: glutamate--tRNA ligase [Thermoanaerobaculia bacterium]|nr:glutamate--tRNA ligase [Thermoanaerobaculia bacterium]